MASCILNWYADRGFELDVDAASDDVSVRLQAVPVPADGTIELRAAPIPLDRLEILFKAQVDVEGEPGQLQSVTVQVVDGEDGRPALDLRAQVEDVETGQVMPFEVRVAVVLPQGAPDQGGPRPTPPDEDELDWEDETTLEQLIVSGPEANASAAPPSEGFFGLAALKAALEKLDDEDPIDDSDLDEGDPIDDDLPPLPASPPDLEVHETEDPPPAGHDQSFTAEQEAAGLLELLIDRDGLELEDGYEVDALVPGLVGILALPMPSEMRAQRLSAWLLDQEAVGDLFIDDDQLAEILDQW